MLIDEILGQPMPLLNDDRRRLMEQIFAKTERFVLAPGFTAAATILARENHEAHERLLKLLPLCRPPYPFTWMECCQADRAAAGWGQSDNTDPLIHPVKRVGMLIEASHSGDKELYLLSLFWSLADVRLGWSSSAVSLIYDLNGNTEWIDKYFNAMNHYGEKLPDDLRIPDATLARLYPAWQRTRDKILNSSKAQLASSIALGRRVGIPMPNRFIVDNDLANSRTGVEFLQMMGAASLNDWGGEIDFWMVVLAMLASKNLCELGPVTDHAALNRKRGKAGKPALLSYRTCHIDRRIVVKHKAAGHGEGMRAHFVRGHFKQRKTGLFWWHPFTRGNEILGWVEKDYEVRV